jgi:hypothetical protein
MPTYPRKLLVPAGFEGAVHVQSRCVRRAWLCGRDPLSGVDHEHRRGWALERLRQLTGVFAIEVCAYAIMANHAHFVLWVRPVFAAAWSAEEVARRWLSLFGANAAGTEELAPAAPDLAAVQALASDPGRIAELRARLANVSWFMRSFNEWLARRANREDGCTGRFWEGRFKCQTLEDEGAVLACMAYVDLNPVRAGAAATLEQSDYTSIAERLIALRARARLAALREECSGASAVPSGGSAAPVSAVAQAPAGAVSSAAGLSPAASGLLARALAEAAADRWLSPLDGRRGLLDLRVESYLELLEWTGARVVEGKPGVLPAGARPILEQMELDVERWVETVNGYGGLFRRVGGKLASLRRKAREMGQRWVAGMRASRRVFRTARAPAAA